MPLVHVYLYEGRDESQKAKIAKAVTKAISDTAGVEDSATTVILHDTPRENWADGGVLASQK